MHNQTIFSAPILEELRSFKTNKKYFLSSSGSINEFDGSDIEKIVSICNQDRVYEMIFRDRLDGRKYEKADAENFIDWLVTGWQEQSYFVFLIKDEDGDIVGAVDIKSNDLDRSEIGYWADSNHSGIMTNAVGVLIQLAKKAGFKSLFATTKIDNARSQNVLLRNGFVKKDGVDKENNGRRFLFELALI